MLRAGIDVGGTSAKIGLVDSSGAIVRRSAIPTGPDLAADELVTRLAGALLKLRGAECVDALGVAAPGCRRADGEGVVNVTNLPKIDGYPLRQRLEDAADLPARLDNDANAAALGEARFGAGRGSHRLLVVTVGTGIGAGMVVDGAVHRVAWGGLGDPGHVIVRRFGPRCACGGHGCVEALASVPALLRRAGEAQLPGYTDFGTLVTAAVRGESPAADVLKEGGADLGMALASLVHLLTPDLILLGGGGLDAAEELLMEPVRESLRAHVQPFFGNRLKLGRAALGNDAGLIGAAALAELA